MSDGYLGPLAGYKVLVTRPEEQALEMANLIAALGGEPIVFPLIQLVEPKDETFIQELDQLFAQLSLFEWIVFTSVNGVRRFINQMERRGVEVEALARARLVAVGPATQRALEDRRLVVEPLPTDYQAEGVLALLEPMLKPGAHVLLPRGDLSRSILPETLRRWGMAVKEVTLYENIMYEGDPVREREIIRYLQQGVLDFITFTSSSTVRNFMVVLNRNSMDPDLILKKTKVVCIGPVTVETANSLGMHVDGMAQESTLSSLITTIVKLANRRKAE